MCLTLWDCVRHCVLLCLVVFVLTVMHRLHKRNWHIKKANYKREAWEAVGVERQKQREQLRQKRLGHRVLSERLHGCTGL